MRLSAVVVVLACVTTLSCATVSHSAAHGALVGQGVWFCGEPPAGLNLAVSGLKTDPGSWTFALVGVGPDCGLVLNAYSGPWTPAGGCVRSSSVDVYLCLTTPTAKGPFVGYRIEFCPTIDPCFSVPGGWITAVVNEF